MAQYSQNGPVETESARNGYTQIRSVKVVFVHNDSTTDTYYPGHVLLDRQSSGVLWHRTYDTTVSITGGVSSFFRAQHYRDGNLLGTYNVYDTIQARHGDVIKVIDQTSSFTISPTAGVTVGRSDGSTSFTASFTATSGSQAPTIRDVQSDIDFGADINSTSSTSGTLLIKRRTQMNLIVRVTHDTSVGNEDYLRLPGIGYVPDYDGELTFSLPYNSSAYNFNLSEQILSFGLKQPYSSGKRGTDFLNLTIDIAEDTANYVSMETSDHLRISVIGSSTGLNYDNTGVVSGRTLAYQYSKTFVQAVSVPTVSSGSSSGGSGSGGFSGGGGSSNPYIVDSGE